MSITILGQRFQIQFVDTLEPGVYGETSGHKGLIRLSSNMSEDQTHKTLVHEIIHAALHISGWSEVLNKSDVEEEGLVILLENALAPIISLTYE